MVVVGVGNLTPDGRGGGNLIDLPRFHVTRCVVSFTLRGFFHAAWFLSRCVVSFITRATGVQKAKQTRARNKERSK